MLELNSTSAFHCFPLDVSGKLGVDVETMHLNNSMDLGQVGDLLDCVCVCESS